MSLVLASVATYREVREYWDINEIHAMQEILDIRADIEAEEHAKMKAKAALKR